MVGNRFRKRRQSNFAQFSEEERLGCCNGVSYPTSQGSNCKTWRERWDNSSPGSHIEKVELAKKLVDLMRPEDLETQNSRGLTALHYVIERTPESVELAKCMVDKNMKLLSIVFPEKTITPLVGKITPLIQAHSRSHEKGEKMAQYLYSVTPHETLNDSECAMLIIHGFMLKRFDIAWDLIQRRPELVIAKDFYGRTPLNKLAGMRSAFLSGSSLNFCEQWIYDGIQIKPMPTTEEPIHTTDDDVCINVQKPEDGNQSSKRQGHLICSGTHVT
ncbi:uncharacterized protein LOC125474920 [Pyrus x bretschneideri]|uniref:uncharacterized protein LOC125474920 n=1 Tax=Pyrus x bretschneideri TaxID=225117 RepID=UPI00202F9968|nr:uncharacterized protein LOC125474920 [Pyrus x bretschneideri]